MSQCSLSRVLLATESARVKSVCFSPGNQTSSNCCQPRLLVTLYSGDAELWLLPPAAEEQDKPTAAAEAQLVRRYSVGTQPLRSGTFLKDGRVALACDDGYVYVGNEAQSELAGSRAQESSADCVMEVRDASQMHQVDISHGCFVRSVVAHPDTNGFFASSGNSLTLFI